MFYHGSFAGSLSTIRGSSLASFSFSEVSFTSCGLVRAYRLSSRVMGISPGRHGAFPSKYDDGRNVGRSTGLRMCSGGPRIVSRPYVAGQFLCFSGTTSEFSGTSAGGDVSYIHIVTACGDLDSSSDMSVFSWSVVTSHRAMRVNFFGSSSGCLGPVPCFMP